MTQTCDTPTCEKCTTRRASHHAKIFLAGALILTSTVLIGTMIFIDNKFNEVRGLITQTHELVDRLPPALERTEKLVDRVDATVKHGIAEIRDNARGTSKGIVDGVRDALSR